MQAVSGDFGGRRLLETCLVVAQMVPAHGCRQRWPRRISPRGVRFPAKCASAAKCGGKVLCPRARVSPRYCSFGVANWTARVGLVPRCVRRRRRGECCMQVVDSRVGLLSFLNSAPPWNFFLGPTRSPTQCASESSTVLHCPRSFATSLVEVTCPAPSHHPAAERTCADFEQILVAGSVVAAHTEVPRIEKTAGKQSARRRRPTSSRGPITPGQITQSRAKRAVRPRLLHTMTTTRRMSSTGATKTMSRQAT